MLDAKCRGMGQELFFPTRGGGQRKGKKVCEQCTVRAECRDYAERTNTHYGIWGGEVLSREKEPDEAQPNICSAPQLVGLPSLPVIAMELPRNPPVTLSEAVGFSKVLPLLPPD